METVTVQCAEMCINVARGKQIELATVDVNGSHPNRIPEAPTAVEHWFIISMDPAPEAGQMTGAGANVRGPGETENV